MAKNLRDKLTDIQTKAGANVSVEIRLNVYAPDTVDESYWVAPSAVVNLSWVQLTEIEYKEIFQFFNNETMLPNRKETEAKPLHDILSLIRSTRATNALNPTLQPLSVRPVKK